jgi:DNA polymerase-3 subunit beta
MSKTRKSDAPSTPTASSLSRPSANKPITGLHATVPREHLASMQHVIKAITAPPSASNPALNMVYVEAIGDGLLRVVATDTEQSFQTDVEAVVERPGKCLIHGDKFALVSTVMPDGAIELRECGPRVDVVGGDMTLSLVTMPTDDFPLPGNMSEQRGELRVIKVKAGALLEAMAFTVPLVCPDDNRYGINGIHLEWQEDLLRLVATDGHRLSYAGAEVIYRSHAEKPLGERELLPRKALAQMTSLLGKVSAALEVELHFNGSAAELRIERSMYRFRLIDGEFPDYRRVIPAVHSYAIEMELGRVGAMIKRVNAMRIAAGKPVEMSFKTDADVLEVTGQDDNKNSVEDRVPLRLLTKLPTANPTLRIGFNAKYLGECLGLFNEATIFFHLGDALSPLKLLDNNPARCMVVMPMRLEQ